MTCTTGKLVYESRGEARKALSCILKRTPKDRCRHTLKWAKGHLGAYRCPHCGHHHIGHEVMR